MKQKLRNNCKNITFTAYVVVSLLALIFSLYIFTSKENEVYSARVVSAPEAVEGYETEEIKDINAPAGVRKEYSWKIGDISNNESSLMFYVVHSYVEVYFDDELMYSLSAGDNKHTGASTSSNWVVVPLYQSDSGRTVTVNVTPVYKSSINRKIEFVIGSKYDVFMNRLKTDAPKIALSALCILMGLVIMIEEIYHIIRKRTSSWSLFYLGDFSLLIGIWRITDTRFSPIMFEGHAGALGYITLTSLLIMAIPYLLFVCEQRKGKCGVMLRAFSLINSVVALVLLLCQIFGIAELRDTLSVCHGMLIVDIVILLFAIFIGAKSSAEDRKTLIFIIALALGCIIDLALYYLEASSSGVIITLVIFLVYISYSFADNIININKKAYIDANTKLYNKTRWNDYIKENIQGDEPIGMIMIDLNHLKYINDTFGHKTGDKMIVNFAQILKSTFDSSEFVCRWGGDEFTVIVRNATRERMESYASALQAAVDAYNKSGKKPELYFALGYALSTEFSGISKEELLTKADEFMYANKKKWYEENSVKK